jgi:hypothetical protein
MAVRTTRVYDTQIADLPFAEVDPPRFDRAIAVGTLVLCLRRGIGAGEAASALIAAKNSNSQ